MSLHLERLSQEVFLMQWEFLPRAESLFKSGDDLFARSMRGRASDVTFWKARGCWRKIWQALYHLCWEAYEPPLGHQKACGIPCCQKEHPGIRIKCSDSFDQHKVFVTYRNGNTEMLAKIRFHLEGIFLYTILSYAFKTSSWNSKMTGLFNGQNSVSAQFNNSICVSMHPPRIDMWTWGSS